MELARSCCWPKLPPSLHSIFWSFIGLWVKIWNWNKTACSKSNPVQSSRSKSITCPKKGHLLRFKSNNSATSDDGAQKLENDVWYDSESIATKVCSPIGRKWNATCRRKGRPLRFEPISTYTSDGGAQKLGHNVWHDSESIATKVCSQIGRKWNAIFESHVSDQRWQKELRFLIWRFFKQFVFVINHLLL